MTARIKAGQRSTVNGQRPTITSQRSTSLSYMSTNDHRPTDIDSASGQDFLAPHQANYFPGTGLIFFVL
jgi:hypothetical protein